MSETLALSVLCCEFAVRDDTAWLLRLACVPLVEAVDQAFWGALGET